MRRSLRINLLSPRVGLVANQEELISCQKLIYDTYVTERGWKPWTDVENNRSGFQVKDSSRGKVLIDKYTPFALQFAGIAQMESQEEVISCLRLTARKDVIDALEVGRLDLENYSPFPSWVLERTNIYELNRSSISPLYRFQYVQVYRLFAKILEYVRDKHKGDEWICISSDPYKHMFNFFTSIGAKAVGNEFKFSESDETEARMFAMCSEDCEQVLDGLQRFIDKACNKYDDKFK